MSKLRKKHINWQAFLDGPWGELQNALSRCIVALQWTDSLVHPTNGATAFQRFDPRLQLASGCVISVRGLWFFLTAGHVLQQIRNAPHVGRRTFGFALMDGFHLPNKKVDCVPIPFDIDQCYAIDEPGGIDYGIFHIPKLIAKALANNGVVPVSEDAVAGPNETFDCYGLIGFPSQEFHTRVIDTNAERFGMAHFAFPMVPLVASNEIPDGLDTTTNPFVGQIVSLTAKYEDNTPAYLKSIKGMSGGPIFGFQLDQNGISSRLVAVQSSWFELSQRVVGGRALSMVAVIAAHIDGKLKDLLA